MQVIYDDDQVCKFYFVVSCFIVLTFEVKNIIFEPCLVGRIGNEKIRFDFG